MLLLLAGPAPPAPPPDRAPEMVRWPSIEEMDAVYPAGFVARWPTFDADCAVTARGVTHGCTVTPDQRFGGPAPEPAFTAAALQLAALHQFSPGRRGGKPADMHVRFRLEVRTSDKELARRVEAQRNQPSVAGVKPAPLAAARDEFADARRLSIALNQKPVALSLPLPEAARQRLRTGQATLSCRVKANGLMEDCRVASESRPGMGLGRAIMTLAGRLWAPNMALISPGTRAEIGFDISVGYELAEVRIGATYPQGVDMLAQNDPPPSDSGLAALDRDHDGHLSVAEAQAPDTDHNGLIDKAEFDAVFRTTSTLSGYSYYGPQTNGRVTWQDLQARFRPASVHALAG